MARGLLQELQLRADAVALPVPRVPQFVLGVVELVISPAQQLLLCDEWQGCHVPCLSQFAHGAINLPIIILEVQHRRNLSATQVA